MTGASLTVGQYIAFVSHRVRFTKHSYQFIRLYLIIFESVTGHGASPEYFPVAPDFA